MEPHGQARAWTPESVSARRRGPQEPYPPTPRLRRVIRWERNPPEQNDIVAEDLLSGVTHSSTAKAVVSCVGG